jgi:hypothetical protein
MVCTGTQAQYEARGELRFSSSGFRGVAMRTRFEPSFRSHSMETSIAVIAAALAFVGGHFAHTLLGGLVVWLAATWAHIPLSGFAAGIWRWL